MKEGEGGPFLTKTARNYSGRRIFEGKQHHLERLNWRRCRKPRQEKMGGGTCHRKERDKGATRRVQKDNQVGQPGDCAEGIQLTRWGYLKF